MCVPSLHPRSRVDSRAGLGGEEALDDFMLEHSGMGEVEALRYACALLSSLRIIVAEEEFQIKSKIFANNSISSADVIKTLFNSSKVLICI